MNTTKHVSTSSPWRVRPAERRTFLMIGDFIGACISLFLGIYLWAIGDSWIGFSKEFFQQRVPWWFYVLPFIWVLLLAELYDLSRAGNWRHTVRGVGTAVIIGITLYLVLFFYFTDPPNSLLPRRGVAGFVIFAAFFTLAWRFLYIRIFTTPQLMRRFLIVGAGVTGNEILRVINGIWPPPFFLVGMIDDDPEKIGKTIDQCPVLGGGDKLLEIIREHNISDLLVAISGEMHGELFQALLDAQEMGVEIIRMPVMYEELLNRVPIQHLDANWILRSFVDDARVSGFYILAKRFVDILGGMVGLGMLLVIFPFVSLAILAESGRPIFYSQSRLGRGGSSYNILKFRTMRQDAEADGKPRWAKDNDERATMVGKVLRKTHLDEIPQFINVLRGEMSLVGPRSERPELVEMFQNHVPFYRARLLVKPGITGWAQVNYGYASSIEETIIKLEYDLFYIKHRDLWMDIMILVRTPWTMLGLRGR